MDNMNDSWSWDYGFNFYEWLKAMDNITILGCELTTLDAMNSPRLMMTWMTLVFCKNPIFILEWYVNSKSLEYRFLMLKFFCLFVCFFIILLFFYYFIIFYFLSFFVTYGEYGSNPKHQKVFAHIPLWEKRKGFLKFLL